MAQTTTLMSYSQEWSYLITNALPPGGWTNVSYPAAAGWATGAAPMAYPAEEAMPGGVPAVQTILDTNFNGNIVTSFYFRASVTLSSNPSNLVFTANAIIDDGAVFYVNGRRVQNVRMPAGAITHNTFATGDGGGDVSARAPDTFTIPSSNFVQGANVIAVSVHQNAATSSDIAFALEIETDVVQPPVIVTQPESQTVQVGRRGVFSVAATGTALVYRWFANGALVASTPTYTTPFTTLNMDGTVYYVIVSNVLGSVQSNPAILRVVPDTFGPAPTNAVPSTARSNWVDLRFDEVLVAPLATNVTNFAVISLGTGNRLTITNVVLISSAAVSLRLSEVPSKDSNYVVCAYNMQDTNGYITPNSCIGLAFQGTNNVFHFGEAWRWNENQWLVGNTDPTNGPGGISWTHINYPDNPALNFLWTEGDAPLREDFQFGGVLCETNNGNNLSRTPITTYMKKRFAVSTNYPAGANLLIRHQFDDGAVVYLNGTEIYRVNMPAGTPTYSTFAPAAVEGGCTPVTLAGRASSLIRGQNVIAVELHQFNESAAAGHDTFFDMELSVTYPISAIIPKLQITLTNSIPSPTVRMNWSTNAPGWILQSAPDPTGPWAPVTTTTTNYQTTVSQGGQRQFYRVINP